MTITYYSLNDGTLKTVTLTKQQYNACITQYNALSDSIKRQFETVTDYIKTVLSHNA